ncbi:DUF6319 family protein [Pseudonocardia sp. TRM90224]|uniref:DUF6319 family protein n=1 Tax=Pseudonocardia sp. TRM90224 TaxID=2812678 RepID=UPI001E35F273|nr:DUF6319 family protein [Pseudonocardia sp. TRM90224]
MAATTSLTDEDLQAVRADLTAGKPPTVWFTKAAVGVPTGGSAKIISLDDSWSGEFIQVKATGSRDTMFCSPGELTRVRPVRKRAAPAAKAVVQAEPAAAAPPVAAASDIPYEPAPPPPRQQKPAPVEAPAPAPARATPARSRQQPVEVVVTLSATPEGEWTVEVSNGKRRTVRPTLVQPGDVAKAARSLPPAVTEAIESSLQAARHRQVERVERLRAELEEAQRALKELSG